MTATAFVLAILGAATTLLGEIRHVGAAPFTALVVHAGDKDVELTGELAKEVDHLGGFQVEVVGHLDGARLRVDDYRIADIGGGNRPLVGILTDVGGTLSLTDGAGPAIPLSLSAAAKGRLAAQVGAKVWVHGKKLLSGEVQVARYGILRAVARPSKSAPPPEE